MLDTGLTAGQRARLAPHARIVEGIPETRSNPVLHKPFPHALGVDGPMVVIDSDIIVTGSLHDLVEAAERDGRICAFADLDHERWFPEWAELFPLEGPLVRRRYMNAGLVVLSSHRWPRLLERWWELSRRIPDAATGAHGVAYETPLHDAEQDAFNALLMSEVPEQAMLEIPREEWASLYELPQVEVSDAATLSCTYLGRPLRVLHALGSPKPWQRPAWRTLRDGGYVRLLSRTLLWDDVPLRLKPSEVPIWLRDGVAPRLALRGLHQRTRVTQRLARAMT